MKLPITEKEIKDFLSTLHNKKISLVGNAKSLFDKQYGEKIDSSDIVSYGLIPELVGRLPVIANCDNLSEDQLRKILTDVKNSIIMQIKSLLRLDNIELEFTEGYYSQVSKLAIKSKMGARALKSLVENSLINIMFRIDEFNKKGIKAIRYDNYPNKKEFYPVVIYEDREETDTQFKLYRGIDELEE